MITKARKKSHSVRISDMVIITLIKKDTKLAADSFITTMEHIHSDPLDDINFGEKNALLH